MRSSLIAMLLLSLILVGICLPAQSIIAARPASFVYPILGPRLSSKFGLRNHPLYHAVRHHKGVDLAVPEGAIVRSIADGRVVFADPYAGYGNLVVIEHTGGMTSHYGHCESLKVQPGTKVKAGQIIATAGKSGNVTGPHLHFEIRINGEAQNPEAYLPDLAVAAEG